MQMQHVDEALERQNETKLYVGTSSKAVPPTCVSWVPPSFAGPKEEQCQGTIRSEVLHHQSHKKYKQWS
jgi:hypothetical protein